MPLGRRLRIALLIAGVAVLTVAIIATVAVVRVARTQDRVVGDYFAAVRDLDAYYLAEVDAETGVRGFALTGDEATLAPYLERRDPAAVDVEARLVAAMGPDDPAVESFRRAAAAAARWGAEFAEPTVAAVRAGGPGAVDAAQVTAGKALFDEFRTLVEQAQAQVDGYRTGAVEGLQRDTATIYVVVVLLVLAAVASGIGLWVLLRRWITDPLAAVAASARRVASGDLEHRVPPAGVGEVAELSMDVGLMRRQLVSHVARARAAQAELESANAQLAERAEELRRSNRDLEQFAYVASHDLQEPLRKVASFTQLLAKRYRGQLDERADQYIDFAVDGARRMQQLINDLLGFSRVGRLGGEMADVPLDDALAEALGTLDQRIEEAGAQVTHDPLPTVRGERALLVQLLANLVGNAVKFRSPERPSRIHLGVREAGEAAGMWELSCQDNGIGIERQYAERVFVIFQRLHAKDVYEGTGIGLSLCKRIVEYHGGHIWIDVPDDDAATPREPGTTVRWTLPRVDASAPPRRG